MLLLLRTFAQRGTPTNPELWPGRKDSSSQRRPNSRVNYASRSSAVNTEKRPIWSMILFVLSLSVTILIITQGTMVLAGVAGGRTQATVAGTNSFVYSRQWGGYGGPLAPNGVAVDSAGNIFIADAKNYAVYKLARDGSLVTTWGSQGTGPGRFNTPQGIARDPQGNVYVSDSVNNNIQKFDSSGNFITSWG